MFSFIKRIRAYYKKKSCTHHNIHEGWFIQQVRFRECEDCGEVEIEGSGKDKAKSFVKLVNNRFGNQRHWE